MHQHKKQTIAEAIPQTKAEIEGYICQTANLINSPVTQTSCAYWEVYIYTRRHNSKGGSHKVTLLSLSSDKTFVVTDDSDEVLVRLDKPIPSGIFFRGSSKSVVNLNQNAYFTDKQNLFFNFRHDCTVDFLEAQNFYNSDFLGLRRNLTVVEKILVPDDRIFVWGTVEIYKNKKVIYPRLVSDHPRSLHLLSSSLYMLVGLLLVPAGLVFIYIYYTQF
jgi:hypothetical protein